MPGILVMSRQTLFLRQTHDVTPVPGTGQMPRMNAVLFWIWAAGVPEPSDVSLERHPKVLFSAVPTHPTCSGSSEQLSHGVKIQIPATYLDVLGLI